MQRFFSTFPGGRPGTGLLLLRVALGAIVVGFGGLCLAGVSEPRVGPWITGLLALTTGLSLIIGLFTPFGAGVAAVGSFALAMRGGASVPSLVGVIAAAVALLGPGAYSLDARLFGRREIVIRAASRRLAP